MNTFLTDVRDTIARDRTMTVLTLIGAPLVIHAGIVFPLVIALLILVAVAPDPRLRSADASCCLVL